MSTGCVNGRLADPQAYFFADMIKRPEGSPADDYKQVLRGLIDQGMGVNPRPGEIQPPGAPFYGFTCMCSSGTLDPRGRIWLPASSPVVVDGNAWYTHEIQVIANGPTPGSFVWAWIDKGGGPYEARPCEGGESGGGDGGDGGGGGTDPALVARVEELEKRLAELEAAAVKKGDTIGLESWGDPEHDRQGKLLCAEAGGPTRDHVPFSLTSRPAAEKAGPWESWKVREGQ